VSSAAVLTVDNGTWLGDFSATNPTPINLTTEGSLDWIHWGMGSDGALSNTGFNRKSTGGSRISDFTFLPSSRSAFPNNPVAWLYTDGTPKNSVDATNGSDRAGPETSYAVTGMRDPTFTVQASTTELRRLKVYVGMSEVTNPDNGIGRIEVSLPGPVTANSALVNGNLFGTINTAGDNFVFTIDFLANNPGDVLTVKWTQYGKYLNAASLQVVPEPGTIGLLAGLSGLLLTRRR